MPAAAVWRLLSAVLYSLSMADALLHRTHHGHSQRSSGGSYAVSEALHNASANSNPFMEAPFAEFIGKFDIPNVHG